MKGKRLPKEIKQAQGTLRVGRDSDHNYDLVSNVPAPPDYFQDEELQHYWRLTNQLSKHGLLQQTDLELLIEYIKASAIATRVYRLMIKEDPTDVKYNRLQKHWEGAVSKMERLGSKFGFNPVDKSKVWVIEKKEDPLSEFKRKNKIT